MVFSGPGPAECTEGQQDSIKGNYKAFLKALPEPSGDGTHMSLQRTRSCLHPTPLHRVVVGQDAEGGCLTFHERCRSRFKSNELVPIHFWKSFQWFQKLYDYVFDSNSTHRNAKGRWFDMVLMSNHRQLSNSKVLKKPSDPNRWILAT